MSIVQHLRSAAEWLEQHPEFNVYDVRCGAEGVVLHDYSVPDAEKLAEIVTQIGGRWDKDASGELFKTSREVAPGVVAEISVWRADVCERVVIASREVEVEEPDPQAVASLPKVKQTKVIEDVEWRCEPLLRPREVAA